MDFDVCSSCVHGQSNDLCDAHLIHEHYNEEEEEVREIYYRHGYGCDFYIRLRE
jgi:hypothetical protein